MPDVRELVEGSRTVRVFGLDAKAASLGTAQFELEALVSDGLREAREALEEWRGTHAEAFAEEVNVFFGRLAGLVQAVADTKRMVACWPDAPARDPAGDLLVASARVEAPPSDGTSAADPGRLDEFRLWCASAHERVPSSTAAVGLDGVTAEVTTTFVPLPASSPFGGPPTVGGLFDVGPPPNPGESPRPPLAVAEPEVASETVASDPAEHVELPDLSGDVAAVCQGAEQVGAFAGVVALAFREADDRLLSLIEEYPELADELLAGFDDQELGAEASLVVLLAYFDVFDDVKAGEGEDGRVSLEDLWVMAHNTEYPPYVADAASYLHDNPQLFMLVETMNDGMDYARDIVGGNGDELVSVEDIETFLEFNSHLQVMDQDYAAFDTGADPDGAADGEVSYRDLEALADGDGEVAAAASWLIGHPGALGRLAWYQRAKAGFLGKRTGTQPITAASLTLLAVDQQVYADDPDRAAGFVDRRFETLMSADTGNDAAPEGMNTLFDNALTHSDQRGELMERVIAEVAGDGTIHNTGLNVAFANGAAANMGILDAHINAPFATEDVSEGLRRDYLNTHDFLREVSRDAEAAHRLRQGVYNYGLSETANAPDSGDERPIRLAELGRVQEFVIVAQDNALTDAALDEIRAAAEQSGPGPTVGTVSNYALGYVPALGTVNGIADSMGVSAGAVGDWLLGQLEGSGDEAFEELSRARQVDRVRKTEAALQSVLWLALDRYDSGPEVRASAQGRPFIDEDGALRTDLSASEAYAFREWAIEQAVPGGLIWEDVNALRGGGYDVVHPVHGISVEDRQ